AGGLRDALHAGRELRPAHGDLWPGTERSRRMRAMASAALMKVTTAAPTSPLCRSILGMRVHATSYDDASSRVMAWAEGEDRRRYVCVTTVHTVMEAHDDAF